MSALPSFDRETLQQLLASAYAVQESHLDSRALSAIMEVQRLVMNGELDVEGAMRLIAESAQEVAHASGVSVGQLHGDQLVYRAASGSTAAYMGRQVTASLTVSAATHARREILRVEDAETDTRIEAAICRQFGGRALLILPIYYDQSVAGVLEILFSEPHTFEDREVSTYRVMAAQIEMAMNHAARLGQEKVEQKHVEQKSLVPAASHAMHLITSERDQNRPPAAVVATFAQRAKKVTGLRWRNLAAVAVVVVLGFTSWITYSGHRAASPSESSAPPGLNTIDQPVPFQTSSPAQASKMSAGQPASAPEQMAEQAQPTSRRVRVGEDEVDYINDDVTVRLFTNKPAAQRKPLNHGQVAHIGDDVTVRYFTPQPAAIHQAWPAGSTPHAGTSSSPAKSVSEEPDK
jgi:putative methionine-R-sulfoxide reductase with GAF domain